MVGDATDPYPAAAAVPLSRMREAVGSGILEVVHEEADGSMPTRTQARWLSGHLWRRSDADETEIQAVDRVGRRSRSVVARAEHAPDAARGHAVRTAPIEIRSLSKRFGRVEAVRDVSFDVQAGRVTAFLGPNGAGKSTTLRALLGLVRPTSGEATFNGRRYEELNAPTSRVGAVLEDASFHPGRTGRNHLRVLAAAAGHSATRVDEVLDLVKLTPARDRRVKGYSTGMRQRLALAAALLGDPEVLVLDEPANGLDPAGIRWLRDLLRAQAREGRAVLVSSHILAEVQQAADDVVVISRGTLRATGPLENVLGASDSSVVFVRSPDAPRLAELVAARGLRVEAAGGDGALLVHGVDPSTVGRLAASENLTLFELYARSRSLESAFLSLVGEPGG